MAPKIPSSISCTSTSQLNDQLGLVKDTIDLPESEESWDKILTALLRLTALVNGSGADYPSQLVAGCKDVAKAITNSLKSERSRLSGAATDLLTVLTTTLGRAFEPLIIHFVPGLLTLASRPNKVFISRAKSCLKTIAEYCQSPAIFPLLRNAIGDKSVTVRFTATDTVLTCLNCFNPPDLEKPARAEDIEAVIRSTARDANADVRKCSKQVFEAYSLLLPHRVNAFVAPLTPVMKKYLAIKGSSQPVPSKTAMASSATAKPLPPPMKEAPGRARTVSQTSRAPVAGPSRAPAQTTMNRKPPSKPPSVSKPTEMLPPPPRQPSSGPVRPTADMLQRVPAASRPFTGKPFRPSKMQSVTNSSSMTGGFDATKNQGAQRPEQPLSVTEERSPMQLPDSELLTKAAPRERTHVGNGARRVPKADSVPQHSSVPAQKPLVNVKEQKRNPIDIPLPASPSSSTSGHKGSFHPASQAGREPVFRHVEPPLTRSQTMALVSGSEAKGSKESSVEAAIVTPVKDTRTEDLTLEELTTVRPLPKPSMEVESKPEGANTKAHKAQRPQNPEKVAPPSNPLSRSAKNKGSAFRPASSGEELESASSSHPASSEHLGPESQVENCDSQPCASSIHQPLADRAGPPQPPQERVRREKRARPPPTVSDIEQSQSMAPVQKKRQPRGGLKNIGPSTSGAPSSGAPGKVGKDGKPIVRTKEEEEARAARKAAKRQKLELAQELLEKEKAKELELKKARKAERAKAKAKELPTNVDGGQAEASGRQDQQPAEIRAVSVAAMEVEMDEVQGAETLKPEETSTPEDGTSILQVIHVEIANDAMMETNSPAQAIEIYDRILIQEQNVGICPVQRDSPLTEELPHDEPASEAPAADEVVADAALPTAEVGDQMSIAALQPPPAPKSSHTPQNSPPTPPQPLAPVLKVIKPLSISKPLPPTCGFSQPRTPERSTNTSTNLDLPFNSQQFVTPAPLRQHMNAKKRQKIAPATPISKLLDTIQKGFEFNAGDFSIVEETEEEVADASSYPESIAEADEFQEAAKEKEDIVVGGGMFMQTESNTSATTVGCGEGLQTPRFVDTRPRKGKRSPCTERRPLVSKNV